MPDLPQPQERQYSAGKPQQVLSLQRLWWCKSGDCKDLGDKIPAEDKAKLEEEIKLAKVELESNDDARIVSATEKLSQVSQEIFGKIYQQANPNGDPNANGGANAGDTEFHQN